MKTLQAQHSTFWLSRRIFLLVLGLVFLIAFTSLWTQLNGLIGSRGISPAAEFLSWAGDQLGWKSRLEIPTLLWISSSDWLLHGLCAAGVALSSALILNLAPRWTLLLLWISYLSLTSVGDVFLQFQWDNLLLECGLFAIFLAPSGLRPALAAERPPNRVALWLMRWLLFKLMMLSGLVKLWSGDPAWRDLTALRFHYWTQPLPTRLSYYIHQLPPALHTACTLAMFAIEIAVPFLIFGPRRARLVAAAVLALFQLAIAATGNYGFFNLLTLALCVLLVDDAVWLRLLPQPLRERAMIASAARDARELPGEPARWRQVATAAAAALVVLVSVAEMRFWRRELPSPVEAVLQLLQPFRSINTYGLFAVMTTTRPEIQIDGSDDGESWLAYEFKWKPGKLERPSEFMAPHMPRLDWQMWFAALGSCARNPWFVRFEKRLLEGTPEVVKLLDHNPFSANPPRYIRSTRYQYRFAEWGEQRRRDLFWEREKVGLYCPTLTLQDGRLVAVNAGALEEH